MTTDLTQHIKDAIHLADVCVEVMRTVDKAADTGDTQDWKRVHSLQEQRRALVEEYALKWM